MDMEVNGSKVLYGIGAFLGVLTILYFGRNIILDLSPTSKSLLLLFSSVGFLATAIWKQEFENILYLFSGASYLVFLSYTVTRFSFSSEIVFGVLAVSTAVFIGLGYFKSKDYEIEAGLAKKALIGLLLVSVVLTAVDILGSQPTYELQLEDEISVPGDETVGAVVVENSFFLSRNVELPRYGVCTGSEDVNVHLSYEESFDILSGGETKEAILENRFSYRSDQEYDETEYSIQSVGECPSDPEEEVLYIFER